MKITNKRNVMRYFVYKRLTDMTELEKVYLKQLLWDDFKAVNRPQSKNYYRLLQDIQCYKVKPSERVILDALKAAKPIPLSADDIRDFSHLTGRGLKLADKVFHNAANELISMQCIAKMTTRQAIEWLNNERSERIKLIKKQGLPANTKKCDITGERFD